MASFKQIFNEELKLQRIRQVKKAFSKIYKKGKTEKFTPGTFGFDIEFDYNQHDEFKKIEEIMAAIRKNRVKWEEFLHWKGTIKDMPEYVGYTQKRMLREFAMFKFTSDDYFDLDLEESTLKLKEYKKILKDLNQSVKYNTQDFNFENDWVLSIDSGGQPEVSSKILTTKDFPLVIKWLSQMHDQKTSPSSSAHIHIGLPTYFDAFSTLALYSLVDEHSIEKRLPDRNFKEFAQLAKSTINHIRYILNPVLKKKEDLYILNDLEMKKELLINKDEAEKSGLESERFLFINNKIHPEYKNDFEYFKKLIKQNEIKIEKETKSKTYDDGRMYVMIWYRWLRPDKVKHNIQKMSVKGEGDLSDGITVNADILDKLINTIGFKSSGINMMYYKSRNVIEFRYLSSEILENPKEFLAFINYFLFVPYIAKKSKRIVLNDIEFRKMENGKIKIKSINSNAPLDAEPPDQGEDSG